MNDRANNESLMKEIRIHFESEQDMEAFRKVYLGALNKVGGKLEDGKPYSALASLIRQQALQQHYPLSMTYKK